jgi:hypothetical protein
MGSGRMGGEGGLVVGGGRSSRDGVNPEAAHLIVLQDEFVPGSRLLVEIEEKLSQQLMSAVLR